MVIGVHSSYVARRKPEIQHRRDPCLSQPQRGSASVALRPANPRPRKLRGRNKTGISGVESLAWG
jgi:hypothetical protein